VRPLFRESAAVDNDHALGFAQVRRDQLLLMLTHPALIPSAIGDKALHGPDDSGDSPLQPQHHRLDSLLGQIRQLSAQIKQRPRALLATREAVLKPIMKGDQLFSTRRNVLRREAGRW